MKSLRSPRLLVGLFLAAIVAACSAPAATLASLQGNGRTIPLPADAPAEVRALPPLFSCGAGTFDEDEGPGEEASGSETPAEGSGSQPEAPSEAETDAPSDAGEGEDSDGGATCLIDAVDRRQPAQYTVASGDQDAGGRLTIYRVANDGTVVLYVRLAPSFATPVSWTRLVCRGLSITDEGIIEDGCSAPVPIK